MSNLIDDPIPPMRDFAEYMKATYGEANSRIMTKSAAGAFRKIIESGGDISRSIAGDIRCPTLLITGEHDFLATPSLVAEMANAIPKVELLEAAGASDAVHQVLSDWLLDSVVGWLSRQ